MMDGFVYDLIKPKIPPVYAFVDVFFPNPLINEVRGLFGLSRIFFKF
jgi:hypothetical protein